MAKKKTNPSKGVIKAVRHPLTRKLMKEIWVTKKGLFRRNTVYKTYNSITNNSLLMKSDLNNINWTKSK